MVSEQTDIFGDLPDALINELLTRSEKSAKRRVHMSIVRSRRGIVYENAHTYWD